MVAHTVLYNVLRTFLQTYNLLRVLNHYGIL